MNQILEGKTNIENIVKRYAAKEEFSIFEQFKG